VIVLDASAGVELVCRDRPASDRVADRIANEFTVDVPAVFDLEMLQAIRNLEAGRALSGRALANSLRNLAELRATRYEHGPLRPRIWALRHNHTAYDAAYVALAELLEATLVTTDARLARSSGHEAEIELIA
jgi:predicted nucleic acid-binding protein